MSCCYCRKFELCFGKREMKAIFYAVVVAYTLDNFFASAEPYTVHACRSNVVLLNCRTGLIQISNIVLADSSCMRSSCCPRQSDCRGPPTPTYRNQVHNSCNGRPSCSVNVEIRDIGCGLFPSNDYVNITYRCIAIETSTLPSTSLRSSTSRFSSTFSSSSAPVWGHLSSATTLRRSTPSTSPQGNTTAPPDNKATDYPQKPKETTSEPEPKEEAHQAQTDQRNDNGYLDRVTVLVSVAVIVGGVVITAAVISVAVVLVLKKRRVVKTDESYDMPNYSCTANNDDENVRNSNFYDFIPDPGNCPVDCTAKENDYLTPVFESEEAPYLWIP